jgi:uncharacterized protein YehS (DUF1456 family)
VPERKKTKTRNTDLILLVIKKDNLNLLLSLITCFLKKSNGSKYRQYTDELLITMCKTGLCFLTGNIARGMPFGLPYA